MTDRSTAGPVQPSPIRSSGNALVKVHRWISIAAMTFWIMQAISGTIIVFGGEIDDLLLLGEHVALNPPGMERTLAQIAPPGSQRTVGSIWTSTGMVNRYDVFVEDPAGGQEIRINGAGEILRIADDGDWIANGAWMENIIVFHHDLLLGNTGSWIVGISGILLFTNIIMGLFLAFRGRGSLKSRAVPVRRGPVPARRFSWHRAIGLWASVPALFIVGAGVLLVFSKTTEAVVEPPPRTLPPLTEPGEISVPFADAVMTAMAEFPTASLTAVTMPTDDDKSYVIRLLQPEERRQAYGITTVVVSAIDGSVRGSYDALTAGPARSFVDGLFPFHTGEFGGIVGRVLSVLIGLWLASVSIVGLQLWLARRRRKRS